MTQEKQYPSISIDTFDLIICVSLIGGYMTDNWIPFGFFVLLSVVKDILSKRV